MTIREILIIKVELAAIKEQMLQKYGHLPMWLKNMNVSDVIGRRSWNNEDITQSYMVLCKLDRAKKPCKRIYRDAQLIHRVACRIHDIFWRIDCSI